MDGNKLSISNIFRYVKWNDSSKRSYITGLMLILLAANILALLWYIFIGYQGLFHSDSATKVLLAREIYDTGDFFPKDWNYANGDLFVLFGHIFIIPLLSFMPAGFITHAISGAIFSALILYGIWLITDINSVSTWRRIAVVAIFASGISSYMAENLYGQVSYGSIVFFCVYLIFFTRKYLHATGKHKLIWAVLLVVITLLAYWGNPKRAIAMYGLPLIATLMWMILASSPNYKHRSLLTIIILSVSGALVGSILYAVAIAGVNNVSGVANARWLPFDLMLRNIALTLQGVFSLLGGIPPANESLFTSSGLYAAIRFIVASMVLVMAPIAIRRAVASNNADLKMLALFATFAMVIILFFQITTSIPDMADPQSSGRYLVPGVALCLIVLLLVPMEWSRPPLWIITMALIMTTLASSSYHNYGLSALSFKRAFCGIEQINPIRRDLMRLFSKHNLHYGYASYWNAGALSVLSNEQVKIRQIVNNNGLPAPFLWLGSSAWYHPTTWHGETFLLLQDSEISLFDWKKMAELGVIASKEYRTSGFTVFVFPENIARYLDDWSPRHAQHQ